MRKKFQNKISIVTGGSLGIGREIAIKLAQEGAIVGLVARNVAGLKQTLKMVEQAGGKGEIFPLDLRNVAAIYDFARKVKKRWGRVDILVNVAGIYHGKDKAYYHIPFTNYTASEILNTYEVGINAPTFLCHALLPLMNKGGRIINISGTFESGAAGWLPYYVSKRAIEDLTVGLAEELRDKAIRVNCISPSDTATEAYQKFFPEYVSEAQSPERIAKYVINLCSENKMTGKVIVIKKDKKPFEGYHF